MYVDIMTQAYRR